MTTRRVTSSSTGTVLQATAQQNGWRSAPPSGDRLMFIKGDRTLFVYFDRRGAVRDAREYRGDVMDLGNIAWSLTVPFSKKQAVAGRLAD